MPPIAPISQQIWDMKYRLKGPDGTPVDATIEETFTRIANAVAQAEQEAQRAVQAERFAAAMADFRFLPAGRIIAGAGSARRVTLFNCFVMGTVPDDMGGIFTHLREAALTMQAGGGIGYDFSTLRPKGAPVKGVGADASGPLSFMDVWDAMCRTIMSAGHRRGAMMACLACDHPDIEAFIEAKREPGRLRMFNLSVLVTDAFMAAVEQDEPWTLRFGGVDYRTLPARTLWDKIMRATFAYAEPGVIFIDRVNRLNNLAYCETISATNPCVTAETWIHTAYGPRQVADLVGRPFTAMVDGQAFPSGEQGFFPTGHKPVLRLDLREGHSLRLTADHRVRVVTARTRYRQELAWVPAGELKPGDEVVLHDHRPAASWAGEGSEAEGYLLGLLIGDGTLKDDAAILSAWPGRSVVNGGVEAPGVLGVMEAAEAAARSLPHRADFAGWFAVAGRGEWRLKSAAVRGLAQRFDLARGHKTLTPDVERASSAFQVGLLRGLFDADGSVQGTQEKGLSVRLAQSNLDLLRAVQRTALRLGIPSVLYAERRPAGSSVLPDGRGGAQAYATQAQHELVISGEGLVQYADRIGFADTDKAGALKRGIAAFRRAPNRARYHGTVKQVVPDGTADVFDVQVPGVNAFDANGLYVHNCGEQPLPPYGACLLGSVNLAKLVREPFGEAAHIDLEELGELVATAVRALDDVIDVSSFPLEQQALEARAKRRIGLGVTGLADALILCRARYGGPESLKLIDEWMGTIQARAYLASAELAAEKGPFPLFDAEQYLAGGTVARLPEHVRAAIREHGVRNALLTSIAPTGTISLLADNVSSGLEPVFSFTYTRKVLMPDGRRVEEEVSDYAYRMFRRMFGEGTALPDYMVDAQTLSPADHVRVQAAVQAHVDSSISKTINCPEDISFEAFKDIYRMAYEQGCKGCTTYRPNDITGSVLSVTPEKPAVEALSAEVGEQTQLPLERTEVANARARDPFEAGGVVWMTQPLDRPEVLPGQTYKVRWPESDHAIYITINDVIQDGRRRPFEVFINSKNMEHYAWTVALTRMISAVFRRGGDISFVVEELKAVFDPRGGQWMNGRYVPSLLAAIGQVIEQHLVAIGFIRAEAPLDLAGAKAVAVAAGGAPLGRTCPRCSQPSLQRMEGCDTCTSCGYSKCA